MASPVFPVQRGGIEDTFLFVLPVARSAECAEITTHEVPSPSKQNHIPEGQKNWFSNRMALYWMTVANVDQARPHA